MRQAGRHRQPCKKLILFAQADPRLGLSPSSCGWAPKSMGIWRSVCTNNKKSKGGAGQDRGFDKGGDGCAGSRSHKSLPAHTTMADVIYKNQTTKEQERDARTCRSKASVGNHFVLEPVAHMGRINVTNMMR